MSENAEGKSEKVTVTLSVHQVVNYTQEVELTREEIEKLEDFELILPVEDPEVKEIIENHINFKDVYNREEFIECDIIRKCRVCGCTDGDCSQCIEKTGGPCYWVDDDLCSACVNVGIDMGSKPSRSVKMIVDPRTQEVVNHGQ